MSSKPKKLSAMDLLVKSDALKPAISQNSALSRSALANLREGTPVEISPDLCRPWKLADRPENETSHKDDLVKSFAQEGLGQIQPIVVRGAKDPDAPEIQYEVICGRVRWLAAKELGRPVQAIVREVDDRGAYLLMSAENRQRKNISDYAKARSYRQVLDLGVFESAGALAEAEGIAKSTLSLYLGFAELPEAVAASFADITQLPCRTGYELSKACKTLGEEAVLALIPKIEAGELTRENIRRLQAPAIAGGDALPAPDPLLPADASSPAGEHSTAPLPLEGGGGEGDKNQASAKPVPKKRVLSSAGQALFTYNPASRGWLIRIPPDISSRMDESLMLEIGKLLESHLNGGGN